MSRKNFMLSSVEHEKSLITSRPDPDAGNNPEKNLFAIFAHM